MDWVTVENLSLYAYHGVLPEEQERGQEFLVTVELGCDLQDSSGEDDLRRVIDYREVVAIIKQTVTGSQYQLLESLAEDLAQQLLQLENLQQVKVTVKKPRPPLPVVSDGVKVTITRSKGF